MSTKTDMAIGGLLALAAFGFAVVGWLTGLADNSSSMTWYMAGAILGIAGGAIMLDELGAGDRAAPGRMDAALGTLLVLGALTLGVIGFIVGLANNSHAMTWLTSGVVLALLSLTAMLDELRVLHRATAGATNGAAGVGWAFGLLALVLGVIGFIVGVGSGSHVDTWLAAAILTGIVSTAWMFEAEHSEVVQEHRAVMAEMRPIGDR